MRANFELEGIWAARLRVVLFKLNGLESRITVLETKASPLPGPRPSPFNWPRLWKRIKSSVGAISFLFRHWGIIAAGITMAWAFILPTLKWIWRLITGFIAYVASVGIGA